MPTRVTGLATGLDIDSLVSAELASYKSKIAKEQANKGTLQVQQGMYQDVIKQGSDFYTKYLDVGKTGNMLATSSYACTVFSSSNSSAVTATAASGSAIKDNYSVNVKQLAAPASAIIDISNFSNLSDNKINVTVGSKSVEIDLSSIINSDDDSKKNSNLVSTLNNKLGSLGLTAVYSQISGGVILKSNSTGEKESFIISDNSGNVLVDAKGSDCKYTISSSTTNGAKEFSSSSNEVTMDGIKFSFSSVTSGAVSLTGKTDASAIVDKLTDFFEDYNTLLTNYQTLLKDTHDRDYIPLTEEQKGEMTESQIQKWEEKVKQGQLHNDTLLQSFVSKMKTTLSAQTAALKELGITTVKNEYGSKAGTYTIDEKKLKEAIEKDPDAVMKLFMAPSTTKKDSNGKDVTTAGIFTNLKDVMFDNTVSSTKSSLIKKAGTTTNSSGATLTSQINKLTKNISFMNSALTTKETKLYSKYSRLETIMNKYNSQMSNLQSYFGN